MTIGQIKPHNDKTKWNKINTVPRSGTILIMGANLVSTATEVTLVTIFLLRRLRARVLRQQEKENPCVEIEREVKLVFRDPMLVGNIA